MKTNPFAKNILKLRGYFYCSVLIAMVGFAYNAGQHFASHISDAAAPCLQLQPVPSMTLDHVFASAR